MSSMSVARSKLTAQGQISVPAEVRRKLGLGPGSVIEWNEEGGQIVVRKSGQDGLDDTRSALGFDSPPPGRSLGTLRGGIRKRMRARHARGRHERAGTSADRGRCEAGSRR